MKLKKNDELITIVVPVYNVEKYLDKCIKSIIDQTYEDLEIILIDDGSTDNSPKKCDDWSKRDERIQVIHKNNGGLSSARNTGIDNANGNFVVFIDSDDYIENIMIEYLYNDIKRTRSDISICSFYKVKNNNKNYAKNAKLKFTVENDEKYKYLYNEYYLLTTVAWNKIYKISLFKNLRYEIGKYHEDEFMIFELLKRASKISYNLKPLYNYVFRETSITKKFNVKRLDSVEAFERRNRFFNEIRNLELISLNEQQILNVYANFLTEYYSCNAECDGVIIDRCKKELKELSKRYILNKYVPNYKKIKMIVIYLMPRLYFALNKRRI